MEIGIDFVNKEDACLLILIGVRWVQISWFKFLGSNFCVQFLGLASRFNFRYIDLLILVDYCLN